MARKKVDSLRRINLLELSRERMGSENVKELDRIIYEGIKKQEERRKKE